jgi:CRP-like cAMP-binding protein/lysophospholipase L1-like esterase/1-acyl-sn-glycerol-3-phosphate acyltransferase
MMMETTVSNKQVVQDFVQAMVADTPDSHPVAAWVQQLQQIARLTPFQRGDVLVQHHAVADDIHFLVEGSLQYQHLVTDHDQGETISHQQIPWMPIGWSSLHFRRYRVTTVAESDGRLLTLPFAAWQELAAQSPTLWAYLSEFMFRTTIQMLWEARGVSLDTYADVAATTPELPIAASPEPEALHDMVQQSVCFSALPTACRDWLAEHSHLYQADSGTRILQEGQASEGLWLLYGGRVAMKFTVVTEKGKQTAVRYAVRPGTLLCWSATAEPVPAPFRIETTRSTTLAFVPQQALTALCASQPAWVGAIFEQQLWQLRNYLVSTRTHYSDTPEDGGIRSVSELIEDSKPILPINSVLYGVPYLLKNKVTRRDGFRRLYRAYFQGTEDERALASLSLDMVHELERAHRFFEGMLSTYAAVVRNRHLVDAAELRRISTRYFRDALAHVPYAIKGLENLPDDPNCIFIYNHMAYAEDSIFHNGFLFNPDSHFMSSIILEPKYGDGIRVSRTNDITEYWRDDYYGRLGHIPVVTPQSGWLEETPEEKQQRKDKFFADCAAVLASGRPFIIAPEGNITEEDSVTERSPGPLKAGAFLMSARLPSRPKIVPVALANFDKPAYRAVFACVIKPAFSMEERGVEVNDRASLRKFLESYRQEFRGYVEEAIELARYIETPEADLTGIVTNLGQVDAVHEEFEVDVRALELRSRQVGDGTATTVFYGSSTFRMWDSLADDVAILDAVNLGFGGSTFEACRLYFERLVLPHEPARLVIYCGENDIVRGESAEFVTDQFRQFADMVRTYLPQTRCWFVSAKPSPGRQDHLAEIREANARVAAEIEQRVQWRYLDWFPYMLDQHGQPNAQLFAPDQVHLNIAGYGILGKLLRQELSKAH